jgi:hypothetical protein
MTSSRPVRLNPPALEAYHFINIMFRRDLIGMAHYPIKHYPLIANDRAFKRENFEAINLIRPEQMAPLKAMNNATLNRLLWILKPNHFGTDMSTKDKFDAEMAHFYEMHQDNYNSPPSYDQVQSFELHNAKLDLHIHWGQLVELYNESAPDQQEAIHQFFVNCLNRNMEDLLATPAPEVKLPDNLQEQFQAKVENGDTLLWSEIEQLWLRDDIHHQTYRVKIGYRGSADPELVIATAPTLSQAIAFSTIYVNNSNLSNVAGSELTIYLHDQDLAVAEVDVVGAFGPSAKVKLKWNLEKAGTVSTGHLESLRDNMVTQMETCSHGIAAGLAEDHAKFCQKIAVLSRENPQSFTKKLMAVERALGIQWSKVQILEDALGL